jgi:hypothetical protein
MDLHIGMLPALGNRPQATQHQRFHTPGKMEPRVQNVYVTINLESSHVKMGVGKYLQTPVLVPSLTSHLLLSV